MSDNRLITKMEHEKSRIIAEVFQSLSEEMPRTIICDLGRYGYGMFEEFSRGSFEGVEFFQDSKCLLEALCHSFKTEKMLNLFKSHELNGADFADAESILSPLELQAIDERISVIQNEIFRKWKDLEWSLMGEMLEMARTVIDSNPSADILFSSRFGYFYSNFRPGKDGWKIHDVEDYIDSPQAMLYFIGNIWGWNEYIQQDYNRFVPDIDDENGIVKELSRKLPESEQKLFQNRLRAFIEPFEEFVAGYYERYME